MADRVTFPAEPLSVRRARRFVGERFVGLGYGGLRRTAELLTSELVTNALVHARTDITVRVANGGDRVRVEVGDGVGSPLAVPEEPAPEAFRGRGLRLVDTVADAWGVELADAGKVVWFELRPDRAAGEEDG